MARQKGSANFAGTLEVLAGGPIDARTVVPTLADLSVAANFPYPYIGLETYVTATGKKYRLTDLDVTDENAWVEIGEGGGGSGALENPITAAIDVGGVDAGDTFAAGTSFETLFNALMCPTLYPTLTAPSASLAGTGNKLLEAGATQNVTLTATFNRGSISPAYGTSGYRAGEATGYTLNGGTSQAGNTWSETVSESNKSFSASVAYAEGEQPKDSKGGNYESALPAGSVNTGSVTYDFVDAMWANTAAIGTVAKLSLVSKSTKQRDMVFPAQTTANPEVFDIPASWTVTAVQVKNDLSGAYEDAASQFTVTDVTHNNAAGTAVNYKRYTFNMGMATGQRTVRVKWS